MNLTRVLAAVILMAVVVGCCEDPYVDQNALMLDRATIEAARMEPIDQAIITQHTLYPYHFAEGKDTLMPLGCHDLQVLVDHYRDQGVAMNVQRGGASQELYDARVRTVAKFIADVGVPEGRIQITQGLPDGPGLAGYWVVKIMAKQEPGKDFQGGGGQPTINVNMSGPGGGL
jgi:hypothetical protein